MVVDDMFGEVIHCVTRRKPRVLESRMQRVRMERRELHPAQPWDQSPTAFTVAPEPLTLDGSAVYMRWETYGWHMGKITGIVTSVTP